MVVFFTLPIPAGQAFGPDVRLLTSFIAAADPLGRLVVWVKAVVILLIGDLPGNWQSAGATTMTEVIPVFRCARECRDGIPLFRTAAPTSCSSRRSGTPCRETGKR